MGITGLLGFLKDIQRPCHVKTFANQTLGVDGYVWLHRGTYTCAQELCLGQPTTRYVNYAIKQVRLLRHWGIEPYLVFDGGPLPSKRGTEQGRKRSREEGRERANRLLAEGKVDEARDAFNKAVDVTPEMAYQLIKALRLEKVRYVVAPYEADAQLRFLEMHGHIDGILTEDSDLLVYGAKNVVLKLDKDGMCVHIARADFGQVPDSGMAFWTDREFRQMAILSGCDYLDSIEGVGLKTANQLIRRHKTAEKAIRNVSLNRKKLTLPRNYLRNFRVAEHTFLHQTVYDPSTASLVPLHPLPPLGDKSRPTDDDLSGCGEMFDNDLARGVAEGRLCPTTYEPIKDLVPRANAAPTAAYRPSGTKSWASQRGKQAGKKAKPTVAVPRNQQTIANFFTKRPSTSQSDRKSPQTKSPGKGSRGVLGDVRKAAPSSPRKSSKFFGNAPSSLSKPAIVDVKGKGKAKATDDGLLRLRAIDVRVGSKTEEDEYWAAVDNLDDVVIEDVRPLDEDGWRQATQELVQAEAALNVDSKVPGAEAAVVWEDSGDWDDNLPSSQMLGDPTVFNQDAKPIKRELGEEALRILPTQSQFQGEGRISSSPDLFSSPGRDVNTGRARYEADQNADIPLSGAVKRTADQSFGYGDQNHSPRSSSSSLPDIDDFFEPPSKHFKGGDSSFESLEADVPHTLVEASPSPAKAAVAPLELPTVWSPHSAASDPIDDGSSAISSQVRAASFLASSSSGSGRGFAPSPRKRKGGLASSSRKKGDDAAEASPALLHIGQDLRDRFMAKPVSGPIRTGAAPQDGSTALRRWDAARGHDVERRSHSVREPAASKLAAAAKPLSRKPTYHPTSLSKRAAVVSTSRKLPTVGQSLLPPEPAEVVLPSDVEIKNSKLLAFRFAG